jgi:molybdopterin-guanine dinucleotide biosynthesis protein A
VTGVILAGGRATRFAGAPKGLARVGGSRIVDRVAEALRPACDELLVVANDDEATRWLPGVPVAQDVRPGLGALGGLHTAISHAREAALVVAWDMPFVNASLLGGLRALASGAYDAVVPRGPAGVEPLCALYTRSCLRVVERLLAAGEQRARALSEAVPTWWMECEEVARHGDPKTLFFSVNTPEDLTAAEVVHRGRAYR